MVCLISEQCYQFKMAKFEIYKEKKGEFRYILKTENGKIILFHQGFKNKVGCMNAISLVRLCSHSNKNYIRKEFKDGTAHFYLILPKDIRLGESKIYSSSKSMEEAIESVKENAPNAEVDDLT